MNTYFVKFEDGYYMVVHHYDNKTAVRRNVNWLCRDHGKITRIDKV